MTLSHTMSTCICGRREIAPPVRCVEIGRVYCMFSTTAVWQETSDATTTVMMKCCENCKLCQNKTPQATNLTTEIDEYAFPTHIVSTDLPPDIVWWDDQQKSLMFVELTISYETNFNDAAERKEGWL